MKSKFFRILGVATAVAMLTGMLAVAPVIGLSQPTVALTTGPVAAAPNNVAGVISNANIYTLTFNAGVAVPAGGKINIAFPATTSLNNLARATVVSTGGAFTLTGVGSSFKITAAAATDVATVTVTGGTVTGVMSGAGTYVGGVATFAAIGETCTLTSTTATATGTWARTTGLPVAAAINNSGDVVMQALAGIGGGPIGAGTMPDFAITGTYPAAQTLSITVPAGGIGAGSLVGITLGTVNGILNPTAAGSYNLTVATQTAASVTIEAATQSVAYTITNPIIGALPGIVKLYNANSILLWQSNAAGAIATAVGMVSATGQVIELGPGLYVEGAITIPAIADTLTIKASGAKADTIVPAAWTVSAASVKFTGMTLQPPAAGNTVITVGATGNKFTVDGCDFAKYGTSTGTTAETFINYGNTTALGTGTITNCTFDGTLGAANESLIVVGAGAIGLTISKNTFKLDLNATTYASDYGVDTAADVTVTENTFTGYVNFGKAIRVTGSTVYTTINKNTFTGVKIALETTTAASKALFTNNTVDASGYAYSTAAPTLADYVFKLTANGGVSIVQNKITNSKYYVALVAANAGTININYNEFSGNTYGINNTSGVNVDAMRNWWGAASGPVTGHNSANVVSLFYLGAVPSNGQTAFAGSALVGKTTTGVDVSTYTALGLPVLVYQMGSASFATNPGAVAPPSTLKVVKYFDAFVYDAGLTYASTRLQFYGTVNAFSEVWYYNPVTSSWVKCSHQTAIASGGFVMVEIDAVSQPSLTELMGTPFVLAEAPPAAPTGTPVTQVPVLGAVNVPVDTTFTWPAVTGAVSYIFELAEETGQTDKFYLKDEVGGPTVNAYKLVDDLKYNTQYWWRVQAVNSLGVKSAWTTSFFTTAKEVVVVEPTPPVVIQQNPPAQITLEIPPDEVTKVQPIPSYLLWAVIAVGALLVIVVIVLIVRTRRIS